MSRHQLLKYDLQRSAREKVVFGALNAYRPPIHCHHHLTVAFSTAQAKPTSRGYRSLCRLRPLPPVALVSCGAVEEITSSSRLLSDKERLYSFPDPFCSLVAVFHNPIERCLGIPYFGKSKLPLPVDTCIPGRWRACLCPGNIAPWYYRLPFQSLQAQTLPVK